MGTHLNNRIPRHGPPAPVPRRLIIGLPAGRLKDASGAAYGGRAPPGSLTRPAAATDRAAIGETGDVSHARPHSGTSPEKRPLTRLRSFRDDTSMSKPRRCTLRTRRCHVPRMSL